MKKLLLSLVACGSFMGSVYAHELTEREKKQASTAALAMTAMEMYFFSMVTPLTYLTFSVFAQEAGSMSGLIKGAGLGVGLIFALGLSELFKTFCLKDPKTDYNADAINVLASEKNIEYRKNIIICAILGGVLGAICLK